jgi:hypothetical protein
MVGAPADTRSQNEVEPKDFAAFGCSLHRTVAHRPWQDTDSGALDCVVANVVLFGSRLDDTNRHLV